MKAFELGQPTTAQEAVEMMTGERGERLALAGGQDLLALMKDHVLEPTRLVNLKGLPGLRKIELADDGSLQLGALVTLSDLAESETVARGWPVIAEAAGAAATPQIRNLGTVGGNLCQKPRCWYYRAEPLVCLRKGGDACLAAAGDHRHHSIFIESACIAPNLSSLATPATALNGQVMAMGPAGKRAIPVAELYNSLLEDPTQDTVLAADEFVTHLILPPATGWRVAHEEVRFKQSHDWPMASATAALRLDGRRVADGRLALGAVAVRPLFANAAIDALRGKELTEATANQAALAVTAAAEPFPTTEYKVPIARHLIRRVLLKAGGTGETG